MTKHQDILKEFDEKFQDPMTKKYGAGLALYCSFCSGEWREEIKTFLLSALESQSSELKREIEKMRKEQLDKNDPDNYGACYAIGGFNDALDKILKI